MQSTRTKLEPGIRKSPPSKQFPKGSYQARVTYERKTYERTFERLADARRWRSDTLTDLRRGVFRDERLGKTPFKDVAEQWLNNNSHLKQNTQTGYRLVLNRHILPTFARKTVGSIRKSDVQAWVNKLQVTAKPGTVRNAFRVLSPIFKQAVEDELIRLNPCTGVKLPRVTKEEMHFLTPQQVAQLAEEITEPYGTLVTFAAYTGLRSGEICALRVKHLDLLRRRVNVSESVSDAQGTLERGPTKTYSHRSVPLPKFLVDLLAVYLEAHPRNPSSDVFASPKGHPLRHKNFYRRHFKPAVKRLVERGEWPQELMGLRFHDLRHTFAAFLIAQGAHPRVMMERLGHSSIQVTLDRYGHWFPSLDEKLTDGLDAMYGSGSGHIASASE